MKEKALHKSNASENIRMETFIVSCYVKVILNTQQALDCSFRISSLKLIVFSKRLQVFYSSYAINDRVYLLCVILQKKIYFFKKNV